MRSLFDEGGPRYSLLSSKGLSVPWVEAAPLPEPTSPATTSAALSLYPNPASGELTIDFEYDATWVGKEIKIFDINGIVKQTVQVSSKLQKISLSGFRPGIYFIQGNNNGKKINRKFIKL
jgi:hypothetical protein